MAKLEYYGGQGYDDSPEDGQYEVKASITKQFSKLSEAIEYFNTLNESKAVWDLNGIPELLECWTEISN